MRQVIPSKGDQAANAKGGMRLLIAAHGAITLFDPPANGAFTIIVGAIQNHISIFILPITIESQARPEIPAIHEQVAHAIGDIMFFTLAWFTSVGIAQV